MKAMNLCLCLLLVFASCKKSSKKFDDFSKESEFEKTEKKNSYKVTIARGIWGTLYKKEGDCMPIFNATTPSTCKQYTIQREVRVYEYTKVDDATPKIPVNGLYEEFKTRLVKTVSTDAEGFFQAELPDGKYTMVMVEEGKLYVNSWDAQGGFSPVEVKQNKAKINLVLIRAVY